MTSSTADSASEDGEWIRAAKDFASTRFCSLDQLTAKLLVGNDGYLEQFVQEVRRFYPLFPLISGRVQQEFDWRGTISQMEHGSFSTSMAQTTILVSGTSRKFSGQNGLSAGWEAL